MCLLCAASSVIFSKRNAILEFREPPALQLFKFNKLKVCKVHWCIFISILSQHKDRKSIKHDMAVYKQLFWTIPGKKYL